MVMIPDTKITELFEDVGTIKADVKHQRDGLVRVETKLDAHGQRLSKVEKACNGGLSFANVDAKTLLKYGVILLGLLITGSAGGEYLMELIRLALGM